MKMLVVSVLVLITVASGLEVKIGDLSSNSHGVSGEVFVLEDQTLMVTNFNYDGLGPDAFFWVGTEGIPENTNEATTAILAYPAGNAMFYDYRSKEAVKLEASAGEDITLTLPPSIQVSDVRWLSVWCRRFSLNFGDVKFPVRQQQIEDNIIQIDAILYETDDIDDISLPEENIQKTIQDIRSNVNLENIQPKLDSVESTSNCPSGSAQVTSNAGPACAPCLEEGIAHPGNNLLKFPVTNCVSVEECRELCRELNRCTYITYDSVKLWCFPKYGDYPGDEARMISSPRYISGSGNDLC